jgi:hypothetical protein
MKKRRTSQDDSMAQAPKPTRVIVFDFDQTISTHHVFKCLAGYLRPQDNFIKPPYACSEAGQLRKILELEKAAKNKGKGFDDDQAENHAEKKTN